MSGEKFLSLVKCQGKEYVQTMMPKFKYDYTIDLNEPLKKLGLTDGFSEELADFSKMGTSADGKLILADVLHKTFIQVDELGTKAGAATKVAIGKTSAMQNPKAVKLDRPFVYGIIDNESGLPIFLGAIEKP
jgi:serpin B